MNEERLEVLEQRLAKLEATFQRCYEGLFCRETELDCKVTAIQERLADYDILVRMAGASYARTHPEDAKAFIQAKDFLDDASKRKPADKA